MDVYLGLGANMGDRQANLEMAIELLGERLNLQQVSSVYETEPVGIPDQPWFLNTVVAGETALTPQRLLKLCKEIERAAGRKETVRFGPRVLDIDILLYKGLVIHEKDLDIPHPRMHERRFVLVPLLEIAPSIKDPRNGKRYADILARLDGGKKVTRLKAKEF